MDTYNIKYNIIFNDGATIHDKEMNVKKCSNGVEAQTKLDTYVRSKHNNVNRLVVHSCKKDITSMFNNIFDKGANNFGDLFSGFTGKK